MTYTDRIAELERQLAEAREREKQAEEALRIAVSENLAVQERAEKAERQYDTLLRMGRRVVNLWQTNKTRVAELETENNARFDRISDLLSLAAEYGIREADLKFRVADLEGAREKDKHTIEGLVAAKRSADAALKAFEARCIELAGIKS